MGDRLRVPWKYGWRGGERKAVVLLFGVVVMGAPSWILRCVFLKVHRIMISHFQPFCGNTLSFHFHYGINLTAEKTRGGEE